MGKLRVLLITRECLRTDSNEGNVLLGLFSGIDAECANIYCKPGLPDNSLCGGYFQLTDKMALENILHRKPMGRRVQCENGINAAQTAEVEKRGFYDFFRRHNLPVFHAARECLWSMADFRSGELDSFVRGFAPDVIFAPLCYSMYVLAVQRYVISLAGCPAVTYIYDDLYSLRQVNFSPMYWLCRFRQRRLIRKTLPFYRFAYTMCAQQAREFGRYFDIPMRVLPKCAGTVQQPERPADGTVRLIYAGGVYYGRDKTLAAVASAVRELNAAGMSARLDVYTSSPLKKAAAAALDDGQCCFVHAAIPADDLRRTYAQSDIALHVESFDKKNALITRLSFSTKIVDCLASGCAVLAACPEMNAGWQYLKNTGAAYCVDKPAEIGAAVRALVQDKALRVEYERRARACAIQGHDAPSIREQLYAELSALR